MDNLLCLMNPHDIPNDNVLQTIRMMGEYVLPEFKTSSALEEHPSI